MIDLSKHQALLAYAPHVRIYCQACSLRLRDGEKVLCGQCRQRRDATAKLLADACAARTNGMSAAGAGDEDDSIDVPAEKSERFTLICALSIVVALAAVVGWWIVMK